MHRMNIVPPTARRGRRLAAAFAALATLATSAGSALAHGDVTPQAVDTKSLPQLGSDWKAINPYRADPDRKPAVDEKVRTEAVRIGDSGFNQNCARCHGLQAISGGIAPDLRKLDGDCSSLADAAKKSACYKEIDAYFVNRVRHGMTRDGRVYMPPFEGTLSQEAMWAIKSYLETRREP